MRAAAKPVATVAANPNFFIFVLLLAFLPAPRGGPFRRSELNNRQVSGLIPMAVSVRWLAGMDQFHRCPPAAMGKRPIPGAAGPVGWTDERCTHHRHLSGEPVCPRVS